jgi:transketolase
MPNLKAPRDQFGESLVEIGRRNSEVFVLSGDLGGATKVNPFGEKYPERFINAGIAEQNMIGMAAGLARMGYVPVASTFCCFAPGRTYDQIRQVVAYSDENVKIISTHPGLAIGMDGAIHQSLDDLALMRALPNFTVLAPSDTIETKKAIEWAIEHRGPVYIRVGRKECTPYFKEEWSFEAGKAYTLRTGDDITLIAHGALVPMMMEAAEELQKKGVEARVISMPSIKPADEECIIKAARETKKIVTAEDHFLNGGLYSVVTEITSASEPCIVRGIGVDDHFGESGTPEDLYKKYGLTVEAIVEAAIN